MSPGSDGYRMTRDAILELASAHPEFAHLVNPRQSSATHARLSPLTWPVEPGTTGVLPGDPMEDRKIGETSLNASRGTGFGLLAFGVDGAVLEALAGELRCKLAPETVTATLLDVDTAHAIGARAGEFFVVRPDGLVLARFTDSAHLARVADHLDAGTAPVGATVAGTDGGNREDRRRENVWLGLSEALDQVADREGFLTRLAMLLGSQAGRREFEEAVAIAADPRPSLVADVPLAARL
jgi:3-(3-hydroxy-phenyl)propionate hydroxylase